MVIGSSGSCVEICGDGKNFGLVNCDDGNLIDDDGCSSDCEIEPDWICQRGSPTSADLCQVTPLIIESLFATSNNNLII